MKYHYFISFEHNPWGKGNAEFALDSLITTFQQIKNMEMLIAQNYGMEQGSITIIFYSLLRIED